MRRTTLLAVVLLLAGCGSGTPESQASKADQRLCADQASELVEVRSAVDRLGQEPRWGPGEPASIIDTLGKAIVSLTGYTADDSRLADAVDRARDDVQLLHDDLADDNAMSGDGQAARTANAALGALKDVCA